MLSGKDKLAHLQDTNILWPWQWHLRNFRSLSSLLRTQFWQLIDWKWAKFCSLVCHLDPELACGKRCARKLRSFGSTFWVIAILRTFESRAAVVVNVLAMLVLRKNKRGKLAGHRGGSNTHVGRHARAQGQAYASLIVASWCDRARKTNARCARARIWTTRGP